MKKKKTQYPFHLPDNVATLLGINQQDYNETIYSATSV